MNGSPHLGMNCGGHAETVGGVWQVGYFARKIRSANRSAPGECLDNTQAEGLPTAFLPTKERALGLSQFTRIPPGRISYRAVIAPLGVCR